VALPDVMKKNQEKNMTLPDVMKKQENNMAFMTSWDKREEKDPTWRHEVQDKMSWLR